ncbi:hypothetical protein YC94_004456 [Salmonella enterica subsp. diarizonae]|nr:hypothetical protein [Salmonella enterica subsp. arizonae]EEJ3293645.1 hypothetical protein [Salmonella enterica subsp. diarizonae]
MVNESRNRIKPAGNGLLRYRKKRLLPVKRNRSITVNNSNRQKNITVILYAPGLMTGTEHTFKGDVTCGTIPQ